MIKVPFMKKPESCDKCDFGRCRYSNPFWDRTETSRMHGYNCQIEYYAKGRYETVREAPYDEHIVPTECPLIDEDEDVCEKCLYAEETDGSHCYECVKGESKFEPKTGKWKFVCQHWRKCSECGFSHKFAEDWNYCPNCGARMESEDKE